MKNTTYTIRISKDTKKQLLKLSDDKIVNVSDLVRNAIHNLISDQITTE